MMISGTISQADAESLVRSLVKALMKERRLERTPGNTTRHGHGVRVEIRIEGESSPKAAAAPMDLVEPPWMFRPQCDGGNGDEDSEPVEPSPIPASEHMDRR